MQAELVAHLSGRILRRIIGKERLICGRIIADGIDAIENPTELPGALVENGVEAVAVPWIKDFLRIGGADSGNPVGAFDRVNVTVIFQKRLISLGNAEHILQDLFAVYALILNIMDGEKRFDILISLAVRIHQRVINRC